MTVAVTELYDALSAAKVPHDKALLAAQAVAEENSKDIAWRNRIDGGLRRIDSELRLVKWMLVFNLTTTMAVLYTLLK